MSELPTEQYLDPDILDVDRWVGASNGKFVLLDPANGKPLEDGMPEWVQADERLQAGRDHLGKIVANHNLTIVLSPHGSAREAGRTNQLERSIKDADVIAF